MPNPTASTPSARIIVPFVTVLSHPVGACISRKRICQEPREYDYRSQREFYVLEGWVIQKHLFIGPWNCWLMQVRNPTKKNKITIVMNGAR